ncbi:Uracil-DNA glycosylase [Penicillium expansum]|nr:Uracil-DNA glycosylase [Penicillium expansum]
MDVLQAPLGDLDTSMQEGFADIDTLFGEFLDISLYPPISGILFLWRLKGKQMIRSHNHHHYKYKYILINFNAGPFTCATFQ